MTTQPIEFRLFNMECCGYLQCWVNPRFMNYCSECGKRVYPQCKSWVTVLDTTAQLRTKEF